MVLAVIVGSILLSVIGLLFFSNFIAALGTSQPPIPREGVLMMDMSKITVGEQTQEANPFSSMSYGSGTIVTIGILDAVNAIKAAASDPGVKYIYLKTDGNTTALSNLEELRKALAEFRLSGKPVISYIETPTTGGYYLASVADKVYMTSHGGATSMFTGISSQMIFVKDLLDVLGVKVQFIRHGRYKSAGEMFVRNEASEDNMRQNKILLESLWKTVSGEIAESRDICVDELNEAIDGLKLCLPEDFLKASLVDSLMDRNTLKQRLADLAVVESWDAVKMIPFESYVTAKALPNISAKSRIAVIYADGDITDAESLQDVSGNRFASIIAKVRADSTVKAVVLRVNSPGGSVLASEKIKSELDLLQEYKPLVASYGSYAASGGYWISNACDKVFSDATTLTGSIGVFSMIPDFSGTMKKVAHINIQTVSSNKHGDMYSLVRPLDAQEQSFMHRSVERIYNDFISNVSAGRDLEASYVDEIGQGRVWSGNDALEVKLVDEIGTLNDAIAWAATAAGNADVSSWGIDSYPRPLTLMETISAAMNGSNGETEQIFAGTPVEPAARTLMDWSRRSAKRNADLFFARLPYEMVIE